MWSVAFGVVSGLVLFLYGIEHFSKEIQVVAGERLRSWLGRFTKSPARGALLGALLTVVVQSSSATTVIAVGLVNAGAISFAGSLGIIIGANVGSTVTAQLVALKLTAFAPVFIVLGFAVSLVGGRYRFLGRPIFYFGLVFLALALVSDAIAPIQNHPDAPRLLARYGGVPVALGAGLVFTVLVQSSSVTTGVVVLLAGSGLIGLEQGIPLLLGANLGTTSTSLIAAARMSLHARRAAMAHFLFNVGGVLLVLPVLKPFGAYVAGSSADVAQQVANAHLLFNAVTGLVFLLGVRVLKRSVEWLVRGYEEEILLETEYLTQALPESSAEALNQVHRELAHLYAVTHRLLRLSLEHLTDPTPVQGRTAEKLQGLTDYLDQSIERALLTLSKRELSAEQHEQIVMLIRTSNQLEQLGDTGEQIGRLTTGMTDAGSKFSAETRADLVEVRERLDRSFSILGENFPEVTPERIEAMKLNQRELRELIGRKYRLHVERSAALTDYVGAPVVDVLSLCEAASNQLREIRKHLEHPVSQVT